MRLLMLKTAVVIALSAALSACVPDPALIEAGLAKAPAPKVVEGVYAARSDANFTVPALPVEKIPTQFQRQTVYYETAEAVGTVVISPSDKHLYLVTGRNQATRYGISVGRDGFQWSGEALITDRKNWPTWTPPPEMIERKPELIKFEKGQPGGLENPLGARALYLTTNGVDYGYRIHGTPEWNTIGRNASSGCIRMINQDVMDLYDRVPVGAKVVVLNADGSYPNGLKLPPKAPVKKKPVALVPAAAPIIVPMPSVMPAPVITGPTTLAVPAVNASVEVAPVVAAPAIVEPAPLVCAVALVNGLCPPAP